MATSAIWKASYRPWLTAFAPIFSFFFQARQRPILDRLRRRCVARVRRKFAEIVGQRMKLKANRVGSEGAT
jgi:hypothetical protein